METHYLWPFVGGTRRECLLALALLVELFLLWAVLYALTWRLVR